MSNPPVLPPDEPGDRKDETTDAAPAEQPADDQPTRAYPATGAPQPGDAPTVDEDQPTAAFPATGAPQPDAADSAPVVEQAGPAYPPAADEQTTEAYAPAAEQPTEAYAPAAAYAGAPQAPGADAYGQPPAAPAPPAYAPVAPGPKQPDTRPKTFGWVSLGLAVAGLVLVLLAFIPMLWVSLVLALIGGVLLLGGLVFGIITLANKKQGAKGLGIGAIIVSVLGGGAWVGALIWSLVLIGLATAGSAPGDDFEPSPVPTSSSIEESAAPSATPVPTEDGGGTATGSYDEAAYLAEVRPAVVAIFQEIEPSLTEADLATVLPDETLVGMGQAVVASGEDGRELIVGSLSQSGFSEEQATRFFDAILSAAQAHLVE